MSLMSSITERSPAIDGSIDQRALDWLCKDEHSEGWELLEDVIYEKRLVQ